VLYLVRHAMPAFGPDTPPERWHLDPAGRRAAATLRHVVPKDAVLVSSREPKARETLEPTGHVVTDMRFDEVARDEPFDGDFRARRRAYVAARFDAGIMFWRPRADPRPLVVATHGMAMTLWLATVVDLADPAPFWEDLRLPDVVEVNLATRRFGRVVSTLLLRA
jgi:broad specificity phosphatase PhoE